MPRNGLRHLQVGRAAEVGALLKDIERIGDSGAAIRFIIGEYGAGKTFFLNLIRLIALEKKLVTINADLGPIAACSAGMGRRADFTPKRSETWRRGRNRTAARSRASWSGS